MKSVFENVELLQLTKRQREEVLGEFENFLKLHGSEVGDVLRGRSSKPWTVGNMRSLEKLIQANVTSSKTANDFIFVLKKLAIFWSIRKRRFVPLPRIPVTKKPLENPFRESFAGHSLRYVAWKGALASWIEEIAHNDESPERRQEIALDALIVSSVVYGGLMNKESIVALVRAVPRMRRRTLVVDGRVHVELKLSWRGFANAEMRRWQPDPLSATLWMMADPHCVDALLAAAPDQKKAGTPSDMTIMSRTIKRLKQRIAGIERSEVKDLRALIVSTATISYGRIPASLVAYAKRKVVSHSMTRAALQRITSDKVESELPQVETARSVAPKERSEPPDELPEDADPPWIDDLMKTFGNDSRETVRKNLRAINSDQSADACTKRLADFADSLLGSTGRSGRRYSIKAAKHTVRVIARHVACFFEGIDPASSPPQELDNNYVEALEAAYGRVSSQHFREDLARAISTFDAYMVARCGKLPTQDEAKLRSFTGLPKIDANPISFEIFRQVLNRISTDLSMSGDRRRIACLLVVLGMCCGARRLEALEARIDDFLMAVAPEFLVRPCGDHRLKSPAARRRLPLGSLVDNAEIQNLAMWLEDRQMRQGAKPNAFAFCSAHEDVEHVPESIFDEINAILKDVTGDPTMHFHQLRHSFASWLFFSLMLSDREFLPDMFPQFPETREWLANSKTRRAALYHNAHPTRRHAYLVASLLGHASPATSFENYIHVADWLLRIWLDRTPFMFPTNDLVRAASRIPRSTVYRISGGRGTMEIPIYLWGERFPETRRQEFLSDLTLPSADSYPGNTADDANWIMQRWQSLYRMQTEENSGSSVLPEAPFRNAIRRGALARAEELRILELKRFGNRHHMETMAPDWNSPKQNLVLACPRRPVQKCEQPPAVLQKALADLRSKAPDLLDLALRIFLHGYRDNNFVRFEAPEKFEDALMYLQFLRILGVKLGDISFVGGDRSQRSKPRQEWRRRLKLDQRIKIEAPPSSVSFGGVSALSIRPNSIRGCDLAGGTGLRFALQMAFVEF